MRICAALVESAFASRRATGERETCWCKRGVSLVSGMIGGLVSWDSCSELDSEGQLRERAFRGRRSVLSSSSSSLYSYITHHHNESSYIQPTCVSGNGPLFSHGLAPTFVIHCYPKNMLPYMLPTNGSSLSFVFVWNPFVTMLTPTMLSAVLSSNLFEKQTT